MINLNSVHDKKAVLVYINISKSVDIDWNVKEYLNLACTAGIQVLDVLISNNKIINVKYFIGVGKLLELKSVLKTKLVSLVLFSCTLSPHQERNLIDLLRCKIIDRNQLILSIFAQRARTHEGKLRVRLAQLRYLNSRLIHEWSHLERQKGGIRVRGGPGETQLESDRRLIGKSILKVLLDLKKIENQRKQNKRRRIRNGMLTVSMIGYTNAGKSTLFNVMTKSSVDTDEKLFVTLDPTCRRINNKNLSNSILIDTVGFIQNLPKDLFSSFKSTLQEAVQSTLLIHVIDAVSKKIDQNINTVNSILSSFNKENIPILLVMNKIDRIDNMIPHIDRDSNGIPVRVWISARNQLGIPLLYQSIIELLSNNMIHCELKIPINSDLYQKLHRLGVIEQYFFENETFVKLKVNLSSANWDYLTKYYSSLSSYVIRFIKRSNIHDKKNLE